MTDVIHGLVSGLIWAAILGSCLIAIAAVVTAMRSWNERVGKTAAGTTRVFDNSPITETTRQGPTARLREPRSFRSRHADKLSTLNAP
jgi:hypothetical protein